MPFWLPPTGLSPNLKFRDLQDERAYIILQHLDAILKPVVDILDRMKRYLIQLIFILEGLLEFCQYIISVCFVVQSCYSCYPLMVH